MTISRTDTVVGEHFTAASSRPRLSAEIELDSFPSVASLSLQTQRCSGLIAAMHHAIFSAAIACDTIDDSVSVPVRLFQQLRVGREMTVGRAIARSVAAAALVRGSYPG